MMMADEKVTCTMVFEIERGKFRSMNPLTTETPWGIPYAIALGVGLEEKDELETKLAGHDETMAALRSLTIRK
jgi:hypothetical protein